MARNLENKVVVVTGGANGIGLEIVNHYVAKKTKVVIILDINEQKGEEAAKNLNSKYGDGKVDFIKCDVTKDIDEVTQKILDKYKYVDVLVNNAGILAEHSVKISVDINTTALMELSIKYWNLMRTDKGGKGGTIINISSIYGYRLNQYAPIYQGAKFAVLGFSKSLGHEYNFKRSGVRVLTICPGLTHTNLADNATPSEPDETLKDMEEFVSAHDWQDPEDLGRGAVEVFEKADSGTVWLIEGARPAEEIKV